MDKKLIIVLGVFLIVALCVAALYSDDSNHEEIPFKSIGNPATQSHVLGSVMKNNDLIVTIETTEPVTVEPTAVHHSVSLDSGISTVTIFNYTGQIFHIAAGDTSGVHLFGALDKKEYNKKNKTATIINDTSKKPKMTIKLLSSEPDLTTFTEIFEVTNFEKYTPSKDLDFKARSVVRKGRNDVFKTEWFVEVNQSYVVNVTDYKTIQVEKEVYNNKTGENETVFVNETVVSGYHDEPYYRNVWSDYDKHGVELAKNTVQKIKVVYHKKPEVGDVRIQTVPVFCGVECDELTWWNTSWGKRVQRNVKNSSVALTDYQLMNTTTYDSDMNANFSDLRFTNDTGTLIPYWMPPESINNSVSVDIWLKIPSISTTSGATVWMYYNNPAASSASNGDDVFEKYTDGLDIASWTVPSGITLTNVSGEIRVQQSSAAQTYATLPTVPVQPIVLETRLKIMNTASTDQFVYFACDGSGSDSFILFSLSSDMDAKCRESGTDQLIYSSYSFDTYYRVKTILDNTDQSNYMYSDSDNLLGSRTDKGYALGSPTALDQILIGSKSSAYACDAYISYIFARKYTATEPTWGADGAEESHPLQDLVITTYAPTTPQTLELGTAQTFNVTTNITSSCRWYINGSLQQTNSTGATEHAYTNTSLEAGYWNFTAYTNTSTENVSQTWWVTVNPKYKPPEPVNLTNTTGNFWVNHTWAAGAGNVTDAWNVSVNSVWYNRTYAWYNETYSAHAWQNITVYAWNESGFGRMSD